MIDALIWALAGWTGGLGMWRVWLWTDELDGSYREHDCVSRRAAFFILLAGLLGPFMWAIVALMVTLVFSLTQDSSWWRKPLWRCRRRD